MGKGGVGKSFITWLLAQYFIEKGRSTYFADTDPNNATFSSFPAIGASHINITDDDLALNQGPFDDMVNEIAKHDYSVIDNGASSFAPLMHYLTQNNTLSDLQSIGQRVIIHMPLVGGPAMKDTLWGIDMVLRNTPAEVVIWQNDHFGKDAVQFKETKLYKEFEARVIGVVHLQKRDEHTFVKTVQELYSNGKLFDAAESAEYGFVEKSRIHNFRKEVFDQLNELGI
jgi:hypothetical protein